MKVAIASGKGGTGKTFVATNLFHVLRTHGYKVTLVDCDAEAPNATAFFNLLNTTAYSNEVCMKVPVIDTEKCTYCGKCSAYCHYNAIFILPPMKVIRVIEDLCHGCGACSVACDDGAILEKEVPLGQVTAYSENKFVCLIEARTRIGAMSPVQVIQAAIQQSSGHEGVIILDAPPGTSCPFIHTVAAANYVILVTEPTPFGMSDLQQSIETLRTMDKPFGVIINRAGIGDDKVQVFLQAGDIPLLMQIPFDRDIARIYSNGGIAVDEIPGLEMDFFKMISKIVQ